MLGLSKLVVGLDVGSHAVKAVALQPNKNRITLQGFAQARIGNQDPAVVVRKVMNDLGVRGRRVVTSVSGRSVIVRQVETPRLGQDELKAHIAYEADKYIPFGSDEVIIDCQPLPDRPGAAAAANAKPNTMQVLLVAVRRGFVEDHINLLRSAGVAPEVIDVDVFAVANAYELLGPGKSENDKGAIALIDIGASKSNIAIVHDGRLLFTREVYLAGNEITDAIARTFNEPAEDIEKIKSAPGEALEALVDAAMPAFEDLANEIRLSFDYVEGQFDQQVGAVVLTGGTSQLATIADILGNILGRPVHVFDPLAGLDLVPSKYDLHGLDANSPALTVALGLAAHLLDSENRGLGGAQSHGWQPRQGKAVSGNPSSGSGARPVLPSGAAPAPRGSLIPAETSIEPITVAPQRMGASGPQIVPMRTPLPLSIPLPPPRPIAPPPAAIEPPPTAVPSTDAIEVGTHKSGLLVILDDDQEMPPSERIESLAGRGQNVKKSSVITLESFEADEEGDDNLPQLPKI